MQKIRKLENRPTTTTKQRKRLFFSEWWANSHQVNVLSKEFTFDLQHDRGFSTQIIRSLQNDKEYLKIKDGKKSCIVNIIRQKFSTKVSIFRDKKTELQSPYDLTSKVNNKHGFFRPRGIFSITCSFHLTGSIEMNKLETKILVLSKIHSERHLCDMTSFLSLY